MPPNPSNVLLKEYLADLDRRHPCKKRLLHACPFGNYHKAVLSTGLHNRENIGRRFEICCRPDDGEPTCMYHCKPSRSQPSCEALADMFAYIASLEVAPWGDEAFIHFACASTIAFNHRAVQARTQPPTAAQKHWLVFQRAFPPYVDLPAYCVTIAVLDAPLMVTPVTFAGLLSNPMPRKTGLLPPCDHRVKVLVALYQINNFQASLLDCVGIKRGEIVEFTLRQTGIFKELGIQDTDRRVLASLEIYLPAQAKWSRAPHPSDKLHLTFGEGLIYRLPHVKRTPDLSQIIEQIIPRALLGRGTPLPALAAAGAPAPVSASTSLSADRSPTTNSTSASAIVLATRSCAETLSSSSFTSRKNGRMQRTSSRSPMSKADRPIRPSAAVSAPVARSDVASPNSPHEAASATLKLSKAVVLKPSKPVPALTNDVIDIEDDIVKGSARFWQEYLKSGPSNHCLHEKGTHSNPIDLIDVDSEFEDVSQDAL